MKEPSWPFLLSLLRLRVRQLGGHVHSANMNDHSMVAPQGRLWKATGKSLHAITLKDCQTAEEKVSKIRALLQIVTEGLKA